MNERNPVAAAQCYRDGVTAANDGNTKAALSAFLMALALDPSARDHRRAAMDALRTTGGYRTLPDAVMAGLALCAADPMLDQQPLAMVLKQLIENDPRMPEALAAADDDLDALEAKLAGGSWHWILNHPLLVPVLSQAINISAPVELILAALRRHALLWLTERENPSAAQAVHPDVFIAMALQGDTCGFPWPVSDAERRALTRLAPNLGEPGRVIQACYQSVGGLDDTFELPLQLQGRRIALRNLAHRASAMPVLAKSDDPVSADVQKQYEAFPYPPWSAPEFEAERSNQQSFKILSAGCGTGRGAVALALSYPNAEITAIDLSRASLAYAQRQADTYVPGRISFGVGDILSVESLGATFDMIECVGVLHHMADPLEGLKALSRVLVPGGSMKLALYSERGRANVVAARALARELGLTGTPEDMRAFRSALRAAPADHPARTVARSIDFNALPALHDLVFNVQEHRYTPESLGELLHAAGMNFGGFIPTPGLDLAAYSRENPHDPDGCDLAAWDAFERRYPDSFGYMYLLWAHKPVGR